MPQAMVIGLRAAGVGGIVNTIMRATAFTAGGFIANQLLGAAPPKPAAAERSLKSPKPPRVHVLGKRRVHGSSALPLTAAGILDVWCIA
jgi:hypothetical protein